MASKELLQSWKKTEAFLMDAKSLLSKSTLDAAAEEIAEFQKYIHHNELDSAFYVLDLVFKKFESNNFQVFELMAKAVANMELDDMVEDYQQYLADLKK